MLPATCHKEQVFFWGMGCNPGGVVRLRAGVVVMLPGGLSSPSPRLASAETRPALWSLLPARDRHASGPSFSTANDVRREREREAKERKRERTVQLGVGSGPNSASTLHMWAVGKKGRRTCLVTVGLKWVEKEWITWITCGLRATDRLVVATVTCHILTSHGSSTRALFELTFVFLCRTWGWDSVDVACGARLSPSPVQPLPFLQAPLRSHSTEDTKSWERKRKKNPWMLIRERSCSSL